MKPEPYPALKEIVIKCTPRAAIEMLGRATYHLIATEVAVGTAVIAQLDAASQCAVKAHGLARILADRIP